MTSKAPQGPVPGVDDFTFWSELARRDPERFEALRGRLILDFLASVPPERRRRLEGLQWRIDAERRRAGTPLAACITLSRMMWDSCAALQDALHGRPPVRRPRAEVVALRPVPG